MTNGPKLLVPGAWIPLGGLLAVLASPTPVAAQEADPPEVAMPAALEVVLRDYERGWRAHDSDALAELFTEDGFVLRPSRPPVRGRDAIRTAYAGSGGPLVLRAYEYGVEGDVGWIIGGFAVTDDGPAVGKFVLALRRGADGRWLIAADIDNGNQ